LVEGWIASWTVLEGTFAEKTFLALLIIVDGVHMLNSRVMDDSDENLPTVVVTDASDEMTGYL
jgi:hypothetical protein